MHPRSHQLTVGYLKCLIGATNQSEVMDRVPQDRVSGAEPFARRGGALAHSQN